MHVRIALPGKRPVKAALLAVLALAALVAAMLPAAGAAQAATPDAWGFAYLDNPTPPPGYIPDPSRQWGSWATPSTNQVTVDQTGLGAYDVHFPLIASKGGIAHTTAVGTSGDSCQIAHWQPAGSNEDVYVNCFNAAGSPVNSTFTVLYTESTGTLPPPATSGYGYIYSDVSGAVLAQDNSSGGTNSVSKGGVGVWKAWLPGLGQATNVGNLQVTAVNPQQDVRCKVSGWSPSASGQTVLVACYDPNGKPFDSQWTLSYAVQRAVHGAAFPPKLFGYAWFTGGGLPAGTSYNSVGATNTVTASGSVTVVDLPGVANPPDHVQATAYGSDADYCDIAAPWGQSGTAVVPIACFVPGGTPAAKEPFFTAYTSAF